MSDEKDKFIKVEIKKLIDWNEANGSSCFASDKITKEGFKVGYMYREQPEEGKPDSGWRFLAGNEDDEYINNPDNIHIFDINTICNYDNEITPYLKAQVGTSYVRVSSDKFELDNGTMKIFIKK